MLKPQPCISDTNNKKTNSTQKVQFVKLTVNTSQNFVIKVIRKIQSEVLRHKWAEGGVVIGGKGV